MPSSLPSSLPSASGAGRGSTRLVNCTTERSGTDDVSHTLPPITESIPHMCGAAQDGGVGVDHDIVADGGVSLAILQLLADRQRPQRHALIDTHPITDLARFTNHHTGTMIDGKRGADSGTRMDVDTGLAMRPLR